MRQGMRKNRVQTWKYYMCLLLEEILSIRQNQVVEVGMVSCATFTSYGLYKGFYCVYVSSLLTQWEVSKVSMLKQHIKRETFSFKFRIWMPF